MIVRFGLRSSVVAALALTASAAPAQTASEKAAAEALFQEAASMMQDGHVAEACSKYQASQELDPALGTLLRLADCYDRVGKSASAWALFVEAQAVAQRANQPERAEIATTRSGELKERLSMLTLKLDDGEVPEGLSIRVNRAEIPQPSWGTALPFDPGQVTIKVSAPGYQEWSTQVVVPVGPDQTTVTIPPLKAVPRAPTKASAPTGAAAATMKEPEGSSTATTLGYVAGGVGLAGLAAAGVLGYRAYSLNQDSLDLCAQDDPNACTTEGKELRDRAAGYGAISTIVGGVGGALLVTGVVLVLTAPSESEAARQSPRFQVAAIADRDRAGLSVRGVW